MRGVFAVFLLVPSLAYADPAPGIDVHVDVHVDLPPPAYGVLAPPSAVAPEPDRTIPRRWVTLSGSFGIGHADGAYSDHTDPAWTARADVDVARQGNWIAGVAAALGGDERFLYGLGMPTTPYSYPTNYDGADIMDLRAVGYLAHVTRRGRFEFRVQAGLGVVATKATRWSGGADASEVTQMMFTPIAEAAASVSIDVYGPVAFAIGPMLTVFNQRFSPMTSDPADDLRRGIDLQVQSGLRWHL